MCTHVATNGCLTVCDASLEGPIGGLGASGCDCSGLPGGVGLSPGSDTVPLILVIIPDVLDTSSDTTGLPGLGI